MSSTPNSIKIEPKLELSSSFDDPEEETPIVDAAAIAANLSTGDCDDFAEEHQAAIVSSPVEKLTTDVINVLNPFDEDFPRRPPTMIQNSSRPPPPYGPPPPYMSGIMRGGFPPAAGFHPGMQQAAMQQTAMPYSPPAPMPQNICSLNNRVYPPNQAMIFSPNNPTAPPIFPCGKCHREVHENDEAIQCAVGCKFFFHRPCSKLTQVAYQLLQNEPLAEWVCDDCWMDGDIPPVKPQR